MNVFETPCEVYKGNTMIYIPVIGHCFFCCTSLVHGEHRKAKILTGKAYAGQSYHTSGGYIIIVLPKHHIHAQQVWVKNYIGIWLYPHSQNIVLLCDWWYKQ